MGIKDLFEKPQQILTSENAENVVKDKVESEESLDVAVRAKEEFVPHIDFVSASNFAYYGSAEKYYDDAIKAIHREYPYDGSEHELKEYKLKLNYLTRHVLENEYPRTNGYVTFAKKSAYTGAVSGSYRTVDTNEYIQVFGGPQTGSNIQYDVLSSTGQPLHKIFEHANKLESNPYALYGLQKGNKTGTRLSNLRLSPADPGMSVEFWLKKTAATAANTKREVVLDLWNGVAQGEPSYGRFLIELTASATDPFRVSLISGSTSISDNALAPAGWATSNVVGGTWNHYAVTVSGSSTNTTVKFYQNGDLLRTQEISTAFSEVTGGLRANLGALQTGTSLGGGLGYGLLSGSLDEFRYWTSHRTSEQIGRNWFTQVRGGSNDEPYNTNLGVYYKFNEGVTKDSVVDSRVLDYSGRISNGKWVGYPGHEYSARSTNSAMVESSAASTEYKDPIIYKTHPSVLALTTRLKASGSVWDDENNASMINSVPDFIREMDLNEGDGSLSNVLQLMGSYFDQMHHLITALPKVRATSYLTASAKPYPFATHLLESFGMNTPQLFVQADVLESIAARDEDRDYERDITEVKNLIYQNIYNNLIYVYKSKGTEKAIRNFVRCFGVDDDLIRLNLYSTNTTYELKPSIRTKSVKTKSINFNDPDKFAANVYQYADPSNSNTAGYIAGSGRTTVTSSLGNEELFGMTVEAEFIFPQKAISREQGYFPTPFLTSSLFGMHQANSTESVLTVPTPDYANFQVVAIRPAKESRHVSFMLTSSAGLFTALTSDLFLETYTNKKWNFAVKVRPTIPVTDFTTGSTISPTYDVHFYGVNVEGGIVANSFDLKGTMEGHHGRDMLRSNKRIYVGAHRENFKGSTLINADAAVTAARYWAAFLDNDDINAHAKDPDNYGIKDPYKSLNLYTKKSGGIRIPKIDALALNWTFDNVTGPSSDAGDPSTKDSFFYVDDYSSGSAQIVADDRYGWMTPIIMKQHSGKGDNFLPPESGDVNPVVVKYVSAAKQQGPEVLSTADAVQILRQDDDKFTREHGITEHYFAIEKSMYQTISDEMVNMFSSIVDFNNLIGDPVNRYRQEYKDLSKLRQLFFEKIGNTPDLDRYIEFYKWIDSAVTTAIQQLIPASAEVSEELHNMVESHVLERNKYWTKFPTIEFKQGDPEAGLRGVHELTYDWKHGHAPIGSLESTNELYWRDRAIRTEDPIAASPVVAAKATITISDAGGGAHGNTFVLVDAAGVSTTYLINGGGAWNSQSAQAAGGTVQVMIGGAGGGTAGKVRISAAINSAINLTTGAGFSSVTNGVDNVTVTQNSPGVAGNKTNTDSLEHATVTNFTGGSSNSVNDDKEELRKKVNQHRNDNGTTLAKSDGTTYTGRAYALKRFTKPYRFEVDKMPEYASGVNFGENKKTQISHAALQVGSPLTVSSSTALNKPDIHGLPTSVIFADGDELQDFKGVSDNSALDSKKLYKGTVLLGRAKEFDQYNDEIYATTTYSRALPARIVSSSVTNGYNQIWLGQGTHPLGFVTGTVITNIHHDVYGEDKERPIQGPFTDKFVGGHQSRHIRLNPGNDNFSNRPEAWRILIGKATPGHTKGAFGFVSQDYPWPNLGKNPVPATGQITFANSPAPSDGDTITISDGTTTVVFEFDTNGSVTAGRTAVDISTASNADQRAIALRDAVNSVSGLYVNAVTDGVNVNLANTRFGTATSVGNAIRGARGNVAIVRSVTGNPVQVSGMSGGEDPIILDHNAPKATRYREEVVKRPVNIKNILQTTASVDHNLSGSLTHASIGNYSHNYEIVQTSPRSVNDLYFRTEGAVIHPNREIDLINNRSALRIEGTKEGSFEWHQDLNTSTQDFTMSKRTAAEGNSNKTVIVTRFSAPGGYESVSRGYLDPEHEETSPNNVTVFRNRQVRGLGQWVATSGSIKESSVTNDTFASTDYRDADSNKYRYRVYDIHAEPWGLRTHLARWTARFGRDSAQHPNLIGMQSPGSASFSRDGAGWYPDKELPGFHKVHRNRTVVRDQIDTSYTSYATVGVSSTKHVTIRSSAALNANNRRYSVENLALAGDSSTQLITLAFWIKLGATLPHTFPILQIGAENGTSDRPIVNVTLTSARKVRLITFNKASVAKQHWTADAVLAVGTPYQVIVTYNGREADNTPSIYINGVQQSLTHTQNQQVAMGAIATGTRLDIGGGCGSAGAVNGNFISPPDFHIGEVAFWDTYDNSTEFINQIYANGTMPNLSAPEYVNNTNSLVGWWRFGDNSADPASSGNTSGSVAVTNANDPAGVGGKNVLKATGPQNDAKFGDGEISLNPTQAWIVVKNTEFTNNHKFDNYFVQHAIPRNHGNYSWIQKSVIKPHILSGLPTGSDAMQFVTESNARWAYGQNVDGSGISPTRGERAFGLSTNQQINWTNTTPNPDVLYRVGEGQKVDFVGLNTAIAEPIDSSTNTLGHPAGTKLAIDDQVSPFDHNQYLNKTFIQSTFESGAPYVFHGLVHHRQGPYGWPSWKQLRGGNHPIVRHQKRSAEWSYILPDADELHLSSSSGHRVIRPRYGKLHHHTRVTPLTTKYLPLRTTIGVSTQITNKFGKRFTRELPVDIQTPFGNEMVYFNKDEVTKELNLTKSKVAAYDEVKAMYTRGALESSLSPVTNIKKFQYSEIVWPRHQNMYMKDVRGKEGYVNNFWVGGQQNRIDFVPRTIHGKTTYGADSSYTGSQPGAGVAYTGPTPAMSIWPLDEPTGALGDYPRGATTEFTTRKARWGYAAHKAETGGQGEGELFATWCYPLKFGNSANYTGRFRLGKPSDNGTTPSPNPGTKNPRVDPEAGPLLSLPHQLHATSSISSPTQPPLATAQTGSRGQEILGIKITQEDTSKYSSPLYSTAAWTARNGDTFQPLHDDSNWLGFVPIFGTRQAWQTGELAGIVTEKNLKNTRDGTAVEVQTTKFVSQSSTPWDNDYDTFKHEVRVKAKDYSVIPEFRMEDHVANYIKQKGSDFLAEQNSLFRMVGMPSGTLAAAANSSEENFYKVYGTSDFMKHFDVLSADIDEHYEPSTITLECNAYLKFNPYEGFYPAQRTVQMAHALSSSYGQHISYNGPGLLNRPIYASDNAHTRSATTHGGGTSAGSESWHPVGSADLGLVSPLAASQITGNSLKPKWGETANGTKKLAFRNFITPLFAPGIMYNTIKAGIACDWPVMTTGSKIYKTRVGKSDYWGLGFPNPERDSELLTRISECHGAKAALQTSGIKGIMRAIDPMVQGAYALKEEYRKRAIEASLVPLSASVAGYSDGLQISRNETSIAALGAQPGFYTARVNLLDLPGLEKTNATWNFFTDVQLSTGTSENIVRVELTASHVPPSNQGRWDKRIPFEALLAPEKYMAGIPLFDYTAHPSASFDVTASWDGTGDNIYSLMTNNFLASVPEFFLKDGNFTSIASRPQDELALYAEAGSTYGMRIKMYRSLNRSRNYANERRAALRKLPYEVPQDPRDDVGLHETFTMYSRSSAFGYPVLGRAHCVRDTDDTITITRNGATRTYTTASLAIANQIVEDYAGNVDITAIFAKIGAHKRSSSHFPRGPEYVFYGTQEIRSTLFHTSSYEASNSGSLDSLEGYNWSYTPPYMHGEAWADLVFAPAVSKVYSLSEILDSLKLVQRRVDPGFSHVTASTGEMDPRFIPNGYHSQSLYSAENINANAMQLDSCLNLFGLGKAKTFSYNNVGSTGRSNARTSLRQVGDSPAWIIQPKFETPMLNFSPLSPEKGGTSPRPLTDDILRLPVWASGSVARGIWHQFGTLPQGNEGVFLEVTDIPKTWLENHPDVEQTKMYAPANATGSFALHAYKRMTQGDTMKSLVDFVGMDPTPRRLGEIRDKLTVNEAVVAVPFVEENNQRWFFTIDPHMVDIALGEEGYRLSDGSDTPGDSIEDMIRKMEKYVFPPTFDFVRNRELAPVAMYVFEFSMTFDKNDLSYIWQNLMPPSASGFKTASSSVTHNLLANELMGYANKKEGKPMKDRVQWLVFKVKQRSSTNYYDKVVKSTPELDKISSTLRSREIVLGNNRSATYSYNWPYDHFSIIEMAQLKTTVEFSELPDNLPNAVKISGDGGIPTKKGTYVTPVVPGQGLVGAVNPGFGSASPIDSAGLANSIAGATYVGPGALQGLLGSGPGAQASNLTKNTGIAQAPITPTLQTDDRIAINTDRFGTRDVQVLDVGMFTLDTDGGDSGGSSGGGGGGGDVYVPPSGGPGLPPVGAGANIGILGGEWNKGSGESGGSGGGNPGSLGGGGDSLDRETE